MWLRWAFMFGIAWVGLGSSQSSAQLSTGWKQHDMNRARPAIVTPGAPSLPLASPSDAVVLFDGTSLDAWRSNDGSPAKWVINDGVMESVPGSGYVVTAQSFGDVQLHIEWASPVKVEGTSQGRGNSGVFLQGLFEVQILDSFDNVTYADGQAAAIYGQYPPQVNVSRKPGEWQSFDILFRAPQYGDDESLQSPATMTVLHNGVLVQDHVRILGPTSWMQHHPYSKKPDRLPLSLQDHGNPVRYRNIWIRELPPSQIVPPAIPYDPIVTQLTENRSKNLVGKYNQVNGGVWEIKSKEGKLYFIVNGPWMEMIPHGPDEFGLRYTAGVMKFVLDDFGKPKELKFSMGGNEMLARPSTK